jgi:hypothetical protein
MASKVLDETQTRPLQAHLESCEHCRRYLTEISRVTEKLSSSIVTLDIEASNPFHERIVRSLSNELGQSLAVQRVTIKSWFIGCLGGFRKTALALGVSLGVVTALFVMTLSQRHPIAPKSSPQSLFQLSSSRQTTSAPSPTLSNYRKAVNASPEKLDELLALQSRGHSPALPILTASTLSAQTDSD